MSSGMVRSLAGELNFLAFDWYVEDNDRACFDGDGDDSRKD